MTKARQRNLTLTARFVIFLGFVLLAAGVIWHGSEIETYERGWRHLIERPDGPMSFRLLLQPTMAGLAALYDGIQDARFGRSPYLWTLLYKPEKRASRLSEGLISTARIILLGLIMEAIYQIRVFDHFYPVQALLVAIGLAFIPYLLLRGPIARVARWWMHSDHAHRRGG
jgi:hypothetical protein